MKKGDIYAIYMHKYRLKIFFVNESKESWQFASLSADGIHWAYHRAEMTGSIFTMYSTEINFQGRQLLKYFLAL